MATKKDDSGDGGANTGKSGASERDKTVFSGGGGNLGAGKEATGGLSEHGDPTDATKRGQPPKRNEDRNSSYGGTHGGPNKA